MTGAFRVDVGGWEWQRNCGHFCQGDICDEHLYLAQEYTQVQIEYSRE